MRPPHVVSLLAFACVLLGVPVFEIGHGVWPGRHLDRAYSAEALRRGEICRQIEAKLDRDARFPQVVRPPYMAVMATVFDQTVDKVVVGSDGWLFLSTTVRGYPQQEEYPRLAETLTLMSGMVRWLESQGTAVLMLLVPNKSTLIPHRLPTVYPPFHSVYDEILVGLRDRHVDVVDVRDVLMDDGEALYFKGDTHWLNEGALAATRKLADRLDERFGVGRWPGDPIAAEITEFPPRRNYEGDLVEMMGLPEDSWLRRRYRIDRRQIGAIDTATGKPIDMQSPEQLMLVGTSYSNGYNVAALLSAMSGRRIENRTQPGRGMLFPLLGPVIESMLGKRPLPKLVIWEIPERFLFLGTEREIRQPLLNLGRAIDYRAGERMALPVGTARVEAAKVVPLDGGAVFVQATSDNPRFVIELATPVPGDGSLAVCFQVQARPATFSRLWVDSGEGFQVEERYSTWMVGGQMDYLLTMPIRSRDGRPVRAIRIDPVATNCSFTFRDLELWKRPPQ